MAGRLAFLVVRCCQGNGVTACDKLYSLIAKHIKIYTHCLDIFFFFC